MEHGGPFLLMQILPFTNHNVTVMDSLAANLRRTSGNGRARRTSANTCDDHWQEGLFVRIRFEKSASSTTKHLGAPPGRFYFSRSHEAHTLHSQGGLAGDLLQQYEAGDDTDCGMRHDFIRVSR